MMTKARAGIWCDYCKSHYGKNRDGSWSDKAQRPAAVTITAELARSKNRTTSYCFDCIAEVSAWPDGSTFTLVDQLAYAHSLDNPTLEALNV